MTHDLDELQPLPQEIAAEEDTPCIPRATAVSVRGPPSGRVRPPARGAR